MRLALEKMLSRRNFALLILIVAAVVVCKLPTIGLQAAGNHLPQSSNDSASAKVCEFSPPGASFSISYVSKPPELNTDPNSATWAKAASTWVTKDCTHQFDYPQLKTEVRGFWTD